MNHPDLHPLVASAAQGELPDWAAVRSARRRHLESVADLMGRWSRGLGLAGPDCARWRAAGWLHDALRDADPETDMDGAVPDWPAALRHGPAVAARLRAQGVDDDELLEALRYHSLGRAGLGRLGRFLFMADYLEPGRSFDPVERAVLRSRLPHDAGRVLPIVCGRRIEWLVRRKLPLRGETVAFWNELAGPA